jgi:endonuclease YncB( thermonuclease family)
MVAYRYGDWKIVFCKLPDGTDVSAWLVRQGWALATGFIKTYESEQDEAEAAKRRIWAGSFTQPWKWRQEHPH